YREIPILPLKKTFFRYPQKIEIQEGEVPGITIESDSTKTLVNPKFSKDIFDAQKISKINTTSVSEETSYMKEVLEKFILEYR
ncbi:MAG: hypothetical protein HYW85_01525, partial [Deltaproteobacteria bacterium]|nr:hypothetical protein [Deltaproteobacteria bacterium]